MVYGTVYNVQSVIYTSKQLFHNYNHVFFVVSCGGRRCLSFYFFYSVMQVQNEEDNKSKWERESDSSDDEMLTDEALGNC